MSMPNHFFQSSSVRPRRCISKMATFSQSFSPVEFLATPSRSNIRQRVPRGSSIHLMLVHVLANKVDHVNHGIAATLRQRAHRVRVIVEKRGLGLFQVILDELDRRRAAHLDQRHLGPVQILPSLKRLALGGQHAKHFGVDGHGEVDHFRAFGIARHGPHDEVDLARRPQTGCGPGSRPGRLPTSRPASLRFRRRNPRRSRRSRFFHRTCRAAAAWGSRLP